MELTNTRINMPLFTSLTTHPNALWAYAASDFVIAISYLFTLYLMIRFFQKRNESLKYFWQIVTIGIFLIGAGSFHLLSAWVPSTPKHEIQGVLKVITAIIALIAAGLITIAARKALLTPNSREIKERIHDLKSQISDYQKEKERLSLALQEKNQDLAASRQLLSRQISQKERLENEIQFFPVLMKEVSEARDFLSALEVSLRKICESTGWQYGEAWVPRNEGKVLEFSSAWSPSDDWKEFRQVSQELRFPPKMGLPGRTWVSKEIELIQDINQQNDQNFSRLIVAQESGIRSALAVPVIARDQVVAILVFFTKELKSEQEHSIHFISTVAAYVSSVLHEKYAEEALRQSHERMEKRVKERTEELIRTTQMLEQELAERRSGEEFLRNSERNYLMLVNSIEGIVWEYDLENEKFTFVSEQAEKILGYTEDLWYSEPSFWQDHIHGKDRERALLCRSTVATDQKDDQCEYRVISADGRVIWVRDMMTVVIENSKSVKLRGVMVDITEEKRVEEALNRERNFASAVLDTAGALVMILDTEGRIVRFNRVWHQTGGYALDEIRGKFFWDVFLTSDEVDKIKNIFSRLLVGQFPIAYESNLVAKDASKRVIAWSNTVLLNKDGSVDYVIATGIDVTKRKEVEQKLKEAVGNLALSNDELDRYSRQLKEANERLKKLDEIKSQFISAASHELRTPLTSLKGYVETILQGEVGPINDKQKEFLSYVKEATDRLHRLLNELLDISKIESGQVKMSLELTNMRNLLKDEIMVFKPQADEKQISLFLETDNNLNSIYVDADKIREVMDNLLSNSIKYTPKDGKVIVYARNEKDGLRIEVQDTGIGIEVEDLPRIFEPFQHIEKNGIEDYEESTGLGLTLAKKIVEAHDGEIFVKSKAGKGSTFTVTLPMGTHQPVELKNHWVVAS